MLGDAALAAPIVSLDARDRIAKCGAGLKVSSGLSASVHADLEGGGLTVARVREVKAAILSKVGEANVEPIYRVYVSCITSEEQILAYVQELTKRGAELAVLLNEGRVPSDESAPVLQLVEQELKLTQERDFVAARDVRRDAVVKLVDISMKHGLPLSSVVREILPGAAGPRDTFKVLCSTYASDDPLCAEVAGSVPIGTKTCAPGEPFCRPT